MLQGEINFTPWKEGLTVLNKLENQWWSGEKIKTTKPFIADERPTIAAREATWHANNAIRKAMRCDK